MTRTLILMRHAKSSWDTPGQPDHDRPLNKRGRKSAHALGDWLRAAGWQPDEALVSTAARTRETFDRLRLDLTPNYLPELYGAGPMQMRNALLRATGKTVLMIGHNPGISEFAMNIVDEPPQHNRFFDYPTCATLVAAFDLNDWRELTWSSGRTLDFVIPRELLET